MITYPKVVLNGTTYLFKYSLQSVCFALENGIKDDPPEPGNLASQIRYVANQAAVCAHVMDASGMFEHAGILPSQMAAMIGVPEMQLIAGAIAEASAKVTAAETSPVQPPVH